MNRIEQQKLIGQRNRADILFILGFIGPLSAEEISLETKICLRSVLYHIKALRDEKKVRLADYQLRKKRGGRDRPVYGLGERDIVKMKRSNNSWPARKRKKELAALGSNHFASLIVQVARV